MHCYYSTRSPPDLEQFAKHLSSNKDQKLRTVTELRLTLTSPEWKLHHVIKVPFTKKKYNKSTFIWPVS